MSHDAIRSQYHAALTMLADAVAKCPDALWDDGAYPNRFWRVAYHALFYTHLYLQERAEAFAPWSGHRADHELLGPPPWAPDRVLQIGEPYTPQDIQAYLDVCRGEVDRCVPALDLEAASGFGWLPISKLELQIYNIRHLQHHAGQLIDRLRTQAGVKVGWAAVGP